jgi:diguanylate cyclase (GGDEF)-like protein
MTEAGLRQWGIGGRWLAVYLVVALPIAVFVWAAIAENWTTKSVRQDDLVYQIGALAPETTVFIEILKEIADTDTINAVQRTHLIAARNHVTGHLDVMPPMIELLPDLGDANAGMRRNATEAVERMKATLAASIAAVERPGRSDKLPALIDELQDELAFFAHDVIHVIQDDMQAAQDRGNESATMIGVLFTIVLLSGLFSIHLLMTLRVKNQELNRLATIDSLTGLLNRRSCLDRATGFSALAARKSVPVAVAVIDLDHFKSVNDRHGHPAGDAVLKSAADAIDRLRRRSDIAARMGGEEFALVMFDTDAAKALLVCERIRNEIAAMTTTVNGTAIRLTASIGLASGVGDSAQFDALYLLADQALYAAKKQGRNLTLTAEPVRASQPTELPPARHGDGFRVAEA